MFIKLPEIDRQGFPKGNIIVNVDAIIRVGEVELPNASKACRLIITELSADDIMAAELRATASFSDSILVAWGLDKFAEVLGATNDTAGT